MVKPKTPDASSHPQERKQKCVHSPYRFLEVWLTNLQESPTCLPKPLSDYMIPVRSLLRTRASRGMGQGSA